MSQHAARWRHLFEALITASLGLALVACGATLTPLSPPATTVSPRGSEPAATTSAPPPTASLSPDGRVPPEFANRLPLPQCGPEIGPGLGWYLDRVARECLLDAFRAGTGAELLSARADMEGDRIRFYYRVLPGGGVEVFADGSGTRFAPKRWTLGRCAGLEPSEREVFAVRDCTAAVLDPVRLLRPASPG